MQFHLYGFDFEEFEREVCKTIEFPRLAVTGGNAIALFTMLVLKELLKRQTVNPADNFNNIIALSNAIAVLKQQHKIYSINKLQTNLLL